MINLAQTNSQLADWLATYWWVLPLVGVWVIIWKGMSLWRAARRGDSNWFIALLVVNTLGILEILYIYVFSKDDITIEKIEE